MTEQRQIILLCYEDYSNENPLGEKLFEAAVLQNFIWALVFAFRQAESALDSC